MKAYYYEFRFASRRRSLRMAANAEEKGDFGGYHSVSGVVHGSVSGGVPPDRCHAAAPLVDRGSGAFVSSIERGDGELCLSRLPAIERVCERSSRVDRDLFRPTDGPYVPAGVRSGRGDGEGE